MGLGEFGMIERYFLPLTRGRAEAGGLLDDAAILHVPEGQELVVSSDTLSAGMHFLENQDVGTIAQKALRSNISDILAMGAKPYCYQLSLALPKDLKENFLPAFCTGLAVDQGLYDVFLSGGDTTSTRGPLVISITVFGLVQKGCAIKRLGARAGDLLYMTGVVGDAWCGLQSLLGELDGAAACEGAYLTPDLPYAALGAAAKYAWAGADISDGLMADLAHICKASGVGADVYVHTIKFSSDVKALLDVDAVSLQDVLSGGDDYQLLIAIDPKDAKAFEAEAGYPVQCIGEFTAGEPRVRGLDANGAALEFTRSGWTHF